MFYNYTYLSINILFVNILSIDIYLYILVIYNKIFYILKKEGYRKDNFLKFFS